MSTGNAFTFSMGHFPAPFGNEIRSGSLEAFMALLFSAVSLLSVSGGLEEIYEDVPDGKVNFYYLMQNMLIGSMLAIVYTNDIFTGFVFVEIITIGACSIVSIKPGGRSLAATMIYLIMSLMGSALLLLSIAMIYGVTGHLLMPNLQTAIEALARSGEYTVPLFVLIALMFSGLTIKSALFPFHGWLPEAHSSTTTAASSLLSGLIIKCYLLLIIKISYRVFSLETLQMLRISNIMLVFGVLGILYGSWKAIRQKDIKLMLSYSSIAQVGYIAVAIGLNTNTGMAVACFHIAAHAIAKAMLFTTAGGLAGVSGHRKDFESLRGAAHRDMFSGLAFIIGTLSMIGIPFFPGFASKLYLTLAALGTPFASWVIPFVVVAGTILATLYYIPAIAYIFSRQSEQDNINENPREGVRKSFAYRAALAGFIALTFFLGLFFRPILGLIEQGLSVLG
ncbi:MAG: hypothetical protein FWG77_00350 [Treponema sp.]|nr:hypothetical protein [Treponema sp.]